MNEKPPAVNETLAVLLGASQWPECEAIEKGDPRAFRQSCERFREYLVSVMRLPAENICDQFDKPNQKTVCDEILNFLRNRARTQPTPSRLLVYYVGHGVVDDDGEYYLLLRDTDAATLQSSGLRMNGLTRILKAGALHLQQYLILDACRSAYAVKSKWESEGDVSLLCSSSEDMPSIAPPGEEFTLFSGALLDSLNRVVTIDDPWLTLREVKDQILDYVKEHFKKGRLDKLSFWRGYQYPILPEVHSPRQKRQDIADCPLFARPVPATLAPPEPGSVSAQILRQNKAFDEALRKKLWWQDLIGGLFGAVTLVGIIIFAATVYPTLYRPYTSPFGVAVDGIRVNRITGEIQEFDSEKQVWLPRAEDPGKLDPKPDQAELIARCHALKTEISNETDPVQRRKLCDELKKTIDKMTMIGSGKAQEEEDWKRLCSGNSKPP